MVAIWDIVREWEFDIQRGQTGDALLYATQLYAVHHSIGTPSNSVREFGPRKEAVWHRPHDTHGQFVDTKLIPY